MIKRVVSFSLMVAMSFQVYGKSWFDNAVNFVGVPTLKQLVDDTPHPDNWKSLEEQLIAEADGGSTFQGAAQRKYRILMSYLAYLNGDQAAVENHLAVLEKLSPEYKSEIKRLNSALTQQSQSYFLSSIKSGLQASSVSEETITTNGVVHTYKVFPVVNFSYLSLDELAEADLHAIIDKALDKAVIIESHQRNVDLHEFIKSKIGTDFSTLNAPQFAILQSLKDAELFEKMEEAFPDRQIDDETYSKAATYYIHHLLTKNKELEALERFDSIDLDKAVFDESLDVVARELEDLGEAEKLWSFYRKALLIAPNQGMWSYFKDLSVRLGKSIELITFARTLVKDNDASLTLRSLAQIQLADSFLAVDQIEEALPIIESLVKREPKSLDEAEVLQNYADSCYQLSIVIDSPILREKALQQHLRLTSYINSIEDEEAGLDESLRAETYLSFGAYIEALDHINNAIDALSENGRNNKYVLQKLGKQKLEALSGLERQEDLVPFLESYPYFQETKCSELIAEFEPAVQASILTSLAVNGDEEFVQQVTLSLLMLTPREDLYYQILIENSESKRALNFLETIKGAHPYEERPYIWQAQILMIQQDYETAQEVIQAAIKMDPSDGEQGEGTRMRAYSILSQLYEISGDDKQAAFYADIVKAIRLSENADKLYDAGLINAAYKGYRESLAIFSDAYCIHARLAVQLSERGDVDAAQEHYEKAFELMPDSFGRVESHCFGCEGAFRGARAQSTAEKVFKGLLEKRPEQPQLHYLMGYLMYSKKDYSSAFDYLSQAVTHDPEYLNAWKKLANTAKALDKPTAEEFARMRVDQLYPYQARVNRNFGEAPTLKRVWKNLEARNEVLARVPLIEETFTLDARLEREKKSAQKASNFYFSSHGGRRESNYEGARPKSFSEILEDDSFVTGLLHLSNMN